MNASPGLTRRNFLVAGEPPWKMAHLPEFSWSRDPRPFCHRRASWAKVRWPEVKDLPLCVECERRSGVGEPSA